MRQLEMKVGKMNTKIGKLKSRISCLEKRIEESRSVQPVSANKVLNEIFTNDITDQKSKKGRRWSEFLISLAFVLYATSAKAYRFVKKLLSMPSVSQLYERLGPKLNFLKNRLTNMRGIELICMHWRQMHNIARDLIIDAVLAVDAASFKNTVIDGKECTSCFAYLVLPVNPNFPSFPVHLFPWKCGVMGQQSVQQCEQITRKLRKQNINILSVASDGDRSYIPYQKDLFDRYEDRIDKSLEEITDFLFNRGDHIPQLWWIADLLHVLKCQRCRLKNNVFIIPGKMFNAQSLNKILKLRHALTDLEGSSRMNDILAIELFSLDNLVRLWSWGNLECNSSGTEFELKYGSEIEYVMPFVLWYVTVSVNKLTRQMRLDLLIVVFKILVKWYRIAMQRPVTNSPTFSGISECIVCFQKFTQKNFVKQIRGVARIFYKENA
jgi:hypothetical protein